jgi:hypothetical protein
MAKKLWLFVIGLVACFSLTGVVKAMTSTNFGVTWDSINSGGDDVSSSTNFNLRDTIGEQGTGLSSSTNFMVSAGYRVGDQPSNVLAFNIHTQENSTKTALMVFSNIGKTVTVASVAGLSVGNTIGVVENEGLSEVIAVGQIMDITGSVITVDKWDGSPGLISVSPSGGDDFAYRMNGFSAQLGTLSMSAGNTSLTSTDVSSDAANGYTVYVNDDGNLRYATSTYILNVSDGSVTTGSEEYGWRVFGITATSTSSDNPFSTSTSPVQGSDLTATNDRVGLVYKAAISAGTPAGNYSHIVFYTATANF